VSLQLIAVGKRHVQSPLYHAGAAGISITQNQGQNSRVPTINRGRETALPCPLSHSGTAGINHKSQITHLKNILFSDAPVARKTLQINVAIVANKGFWWQNFYRNRSLNFLANILKSRTGTVRSYYLIRP